jgi:mannose-1-phosphate guanylyltransferase
MRQKTSGRGCSFMPPHHPNHQTLPRMTSITPFFLCGGSGTSLWPLSSKSSPQKFVPLIFRPTEVETLLGDTFKAKSKLGWTTEIFEMEMCREMVVVLAKAKKNSLLKANGYEVNVSLE